MAIGKEQIARDALRKMNLTEDEDNPNKEPYEGNGVLAARLGISNQNVYLVRQNLILARDTGIDIDSYIVYTWRWFNDKNYAKIGVSTGAKLRERLVWTYHPTDDIVLIGVMKCGDRKEALAREISILKCLGRTHPKREWVEINENFNELIDKEFTKIEKIVG